MEAGTDIQRRQVCKSPDGVVLGVGEESTAAIRHHLHRQHCQLLALAIGRLSESPEGKEGVKEVRNSEIQANARDEINPRKKYG